MSLPLADSTAKSIQLANDLELLAEERDYYNDTREANELRQRAAKIRAQAAEQHNQVVSTAFENAQAGAVINLSDLMASHEELAR